jgi:Protein of unknown function (DUF3363)
LLNSALDVDNGGHPTRFLRLPKKFAKPIYRLPRLGKFESVQRLVCGQTSLASTIRRPAALRSTGCGAWNGWASRQPGPAQWTVGLDAEPTLRDLGMRGDIIKTMHRAFAERGQNRGVADYIIDGGTASSPIIGRLVAKGLHDELTGEAYAVIDGTDGHAHHVRFRGIEAFAEAPPVGGIVEVRRFGGPDDPRPTLVLARRSDIDLSRQVTAPGATWLDCRLVERVPMPLSVGGFGQEVRDAMVAAEHLVAEGLARREGLRIVPQPNLLTTLRRRELAAAGAKLSAETALPYTPAGGGDTVAGTYRQRLTLTSGRFAMIDDGLGFALVPWTPALEKHRGRHVPGIAKENGGIEWNFGRKRGIEI